MRVICDLHIHGRFSRATSEHMSVEEIARYSKIKGLNLVGTGDFTHPEWLREIRQTVTFDEASSLYKISHTTSLSTYFMLTTEVSTIFNVKGQTKKIHHVILAPSIDVAVQINDVLQKHGDPSIDGRPILSISAAQLVEEIMEASDKNVIFPAHAWTPWFSVLGAFSGFDTIEECYQDMTKHIHAIETGLSSDPPMNWRLSKLDKFALISNSDCHSFWPWRIGREANVLELETVTYQQITEAIFTNDPNRFKFTIETDPAYGKYHWTGHRKCNVSLSPKEAQKFNNICPVCRKRLTKGVEQRVEELADRPASYVPIGKPKFKRLLPLSEIICTVLNVNEPSSQTVWKNYNALVGRFGNEYAVLLDASKEAMNEVIDSQITEAILRVRAGSISVIPGFDGVYGRLVLGEAATANVPSDAKQQRKGQQTSLNDF